MLDALSADETDALLDGLGGTILESDQRARIVETAEGNPLFLEQLLALALEGGLAERALPETIQALLAARLDRLGPGERAVLERGAVVGKEFTAEDVVALLDPNAAPTADAHLQTLAGRGFVRPRGDGAFGFRHVLVQEAVYRVGAEAAAGRAARALRRPARHGPRPICPTSTSSSATTSSRRTGCGRSSASPIGARSGSPRMPVDGSVRRGCARCKRGDMHATDEPPRSGDLTACDAGLSAAPRSSCASSDLPNALQAIRSAPSGRWNRRSPNPHGAGDRVDRGSRTDRARVLRLRAATRRGRRTSYSTRRRRAVPIFETADDQRALGRAWLLVGWVHGGRRGNHAAWVDAAERALIHYRAAAWPTSTCLGEIATALYWGPTPVVARRSPGVSSCFEDESF